MPSKICVMGAGSWGTALAVLLCKNGHEVTIWSWQEEEAKRLSEARENKEFLSGVMIPDNILITHDIHCVANCEMIVLAVPSHTIRQNCKLIKSLLNTKQIIVNVAKGFEVGTNKRMSEIIEEELREELAEVKLCVLAGPTHAEEVARDIPTTIVAASQNGVIAKTVQDVFMNDNFRVYTNSDVIGVEVGTALKNVIALCAGISDGLGFGDNTKAALMTRGITEMMRLGQKMGADINTFAGLAGIGDLIVTCTSMHSRNRRAGILIGKGYSLDEALSEVHMVVEGINTAKAAFELSKRYGVKMPIIEQAYNVVFCNKNAKEAVIELMRRDKTYENNID